MKKLIACGVFAALSGEAGAIVITSPGSYVINSHVDEILVDSSLEASDVSIQVVSGGVVQNDVRCSRDSSCDFRVTVTGNGSILGSVRGEGALIDLRDNATAGRAGAQFSPSNGGRLIVSGNVHLGTITGAGSGINGMWDIRGGVIDNVVSSPNPLLMSMSGGVINDTVDAWGMSLDLTGGEILGNVWNLDGGMNLRMGGGHIDGDLLADGSVMSGFISGGAIDGNLRLRGAGGSGAFDILGGQFGAGNANPLWWLGGGQILNVHGSDLVFANGRLTGSLLDGSNINVGVTFSQLFTGQLNLYNVPEPGTLALFGVGLLGAFAARRKATAAKQRDGGNAL
jgi:hypothetical protein